MKVFMCHKARQSKMLRPSQEVSNCDAVIRQYAYMLSNEHKSIIPNIGQVLTGNAKGFVALLNNEDDDYGC
jgi:hypothetical protein